MIHSWRTLLVPVIALILGGPALAQQKPNDEELVTALRAGNHVIVIRHGATNADQADTDPLNQDNIAQQRQLSPKGEQAAKALGIAFKAIGVPVAQVYTSNFNRAYQTAKLAGFDKIAKSIDLTGWPRGVAQ
jgi:hypothetical protein